MLRRPILFLSLLPLLAACADMTDTKPAAREEQPLPVAQPAPQQVDVLSAMDRDSVTVYPLNGPVQDPFTRKNLQPLSQKVLAEGYPVMDPSVTVYPLSTPTAMPNVAMDNVRVDAQSALYSGKVRSQAMQAQASAPKMKPVYPEDDMTGGIVQSELPPIPPPADSPSIWGDVPTAYLPPMPGMPQQAPAPVIGARVYEAPQAGKRSAPIDTSYGGTAAIVTNGMPAPSSVNPVAVNAETPNTNAVVPMPSMPSLTGY